MKKIFATLAIALSSTAAFAAGPTVGVTYDLNVANDNSRGFNRAHELRLSVAQETKIGTFDGVLLGNRFRGVGTDNSNGFEIGYGNGFSYKGFGILGRVAYGRVNQIDPNGGGFTGNSSYGSIGVEGQMPLTPKVNGFVGYRHRNAFGDDMFVQNRYTAGIDLAVTKNIEVRAGVAHTRQAGLTFNGLTSAVNFTF